MTRMPPPSVEAGGININWPLVQKCHWPPGRDRHGSCFDEGVLDTLLKQSPENSPDGCASASEKSTTIRTLLVDDQLSALALLQDILRFEPDVQIIGTVSSGKDAIEAINNLAPDLVFLDIEMPEIDGFGVIAGIAVEKMPIIVFVTAREGCALNKLEAQALDYVVKPWQPTRLHAAIERVRRRIHGREGRNRTPNIEHRTPNAE